jgi:hypothetical protein
MRMFYDYYGRGHKYFGGGFLPVTSLDLMYNKRTCKSINLPEIAGAGCKSGGLGWISNL